MASSFDWARAWRHGEEIAPEYHRAGTSIGDEEIMWALFCEAIETAHLAYSPPPRTGLPRKSSLPDGVDEISPWARHMAYLRGELDEMPVDKGQAPRPSAAAISRAESVLDIWHKKALNGVRKWKTKRDAVYMLARRLSVRIIKQETGLSKQGIYNAKADALADMVAAKNYLTKSANPAKFSLE